MPNLSREQIQRILRYLEETTELTDRELRRALKNPGGILKGEPDTAQERKFGNTITVAEQKKFFRALAEQMRLSGASRRKFEAAIHPRNIAKTLHRADQYFAERAREQKGGAAPAKRHSARRYK